MVNSHSSVIEKGCVSMSVSGDEMGRVVSLHHVQMAIPPGQEEIARSFYGRLLGLDEVPKPEHLARRGGCWFRGPDLELHLGVEQEFRPARKAHVAFQVEALAALRARLEAAETEIVDDTQLEGYERFYAYDPFGNRIEFLEGQA
jgi:catechol 2,3-dioxygenase-like lactoylglutathione lyase family enzyme